MAWYDENRMAVEGQRYQRELYSGREEKDDHVEFVRPDGTEVYEEFYGLDENDDVVYLCDIYKCSDCPRYGDDCDGDGSVEDDEDDRVAYYEKEGDEYVYYDENGCELYREDA